MINSVYGVFAVDLHKCLELGGRQFIRTLPPENVILCLMKMSSPLKHMVSFYGE